MSDFYLRELARDDIKDINRWRNDRGIIRSLGAPFRYISEEVDSAWMESYLSSRSSCVRLAICERASNRIVGAVYLLSIDWVVRDCEFAIWIGERDFQGRGVGAFATDKALEHAFLDLNLNRVYLAVVADNERAISLYKKSGFSVEGVQRQAVFKEGAYLDVVQMSMLASEFRRLE
ncbi:GNAT family N-acetyltransferase [Pseudomonas sp. GCM10022186]|uniref:GNAT family N-acetyltransferase n=1 Tax=Pseudomonas sp. GCM10022186 TaxID=3252650 RepID=UPI00360DC46B